MTLILDKIDHIGIAVENIEASIKHYQSLHDLKVSDREVLTERQIELAFINLPGTVLELIAPTGPESSLKKFLAERGPGLHHICYEVNDIIEALKTAKDLGFELIDNEPRAGARGSQIAFLHPRSCDHILTELCQY